MTRHFYRLSFLAALAALVAPFSSTVLAASGPTSKLYIVSYSEFGATNAGLDMVQGGTITSVPTFLPVDIDIAVYGDVRTMGYGDTDVGAQFDLAGNPLGGGPYINNIALSQLHDGTSDGSFNYSVDYPTGNLLEFDRNWASPVTLFNVTADIPGGGFITMNASDGSFWVSQWGSGALVVHYTHTGTLLGSFNMGFTGSGLALDPVDGTLWTGDLSGNLYQFSQAGAPLQTVNYPGAAQWYGMEFDTTPVPEPGTVTLLGLGGLGLFAFRKRR